MKNEDLKEIIKASVREVLKEERITLYEILVPKVSKRELEEIHEKFNTPTNYDEDEFVDMSDWVKK